MNNPRVILAVHMVILFLVAVAMYVATLIEGGILTWPH
jgi:hypothetical protein